MGAMKAAGLSKAARDNHQFIRGALRRGKSGNEILSDLRGKGRGMSRRNLQQAIRFFTGIEDTAKALRSMKSDSILDPSRLKLTRGGHMSRQYAYDVSFPALDSNKEPMTRYTRVITDTPLSRDDLLEEAIKSLTTDAGDQKYGETVDYLAMRHEGGWTRGVPVDE